MTCPTADARLGGVLTVYLVEDISNLFLRKSLGIKNSRESVTFLFLISQYSVSLR